MKSFLSYVTTYLITVVPLTAATFAVFRFILKMKEWFLSDALMILVPIIVYGVMDSLRLDRQIGVSTSNNFKVSILIGFVCAGIFLIRCFLANRNAESTKKYSNWSVIVMTLFAVCILLIAPPFPD